MSILHNPADLAPWYRRGGRRATMLSAVFLLVVAGVLLVRASRFAGDDFWRPRAAVRAYLHGEITDFYSRQARMRLAPASPEPELHVAAMGSERAAGYLAWRFDQRALGYSGIDIVHTPFLLLTMLPFSCTSYAADHLAYALFSLVCLLGSIVLIGRMLEFSPAVSLAMAGSVALLLLAETVELTHSNVNPIQVAALGLFLWLGSRPARKHVLAAGCVLGLAVMLKPNLALVPVTVAMVWLGGGLVRETLMATVGFVLGSILALGLSAMVFSASAWLQWWSILPELVASPQRGEDTNISMASLLLGGLGIDLSVVMLLAMLSMFSWIACRPRQRPLDDSTRLRRTFLGTGAGSLIMLLSARLVWIHYVLLALPVILYAARHSGAKTLHGRVGIGALCLISSAVHYLCVSLGTKAWMTALVTHNLGLTLLFVWTLVELRRLPPDCPKDSTSEQR